MPINKKDATRIIEIFELQYKSLEIVLTTIQKDEITFLTNEAQEGFEHLLQIATNNLKSGQEALAEIKNYLKDEIT